MPACLIDTCVWLAVSFEAHPCHQQTRQALLKAYGVPKATNRDVFHALQSFSALPQVAVVEKPPNLMPGWMKLACLDQAAPKRWMDAYLAAFAVAGRWRLITLDRDFLNFVDHGLDLQLL